MGCASVTGPLTEHRHNNLVATPNLDRGCDSDRYRGVATDGPALAEYAVFKVGDMAAALATAIARPLPTQLGEEPFGIAPLPIKL